MSRHPNDDGADHILSVRLMSRTLVTQADDETPARFVFDLEVCGEPLRVAASALGEWEPANRPGDRETWSSIRRRFGPDLERMMDGKLRGWVGAKSRRDD